MKKLLRVSKILHVVVLLCCFLPAIMPSCEDPAPSKEELERKEMRRQDSIAKAPSIIDTLQTAQADTIAENKTDTLGNEKTVDTLQTIVAENKPDTTVSKTKADESGIPETITMAFLYPDGKNLSVFGYSFYWFTSCCPVLFFLLHCWGAIARFKNKSLLFIFWLSLAGQIALLFFLLRNSFEAIVWGFWVVYAFSLLNTLLNGWIYFADKKNKAFNTWGDL